MIAHSIYEKDASGLSVGVHEGSEFGSILFINRIGRIAMKVNAIRSSSMDWESLRVGNRSKTSSERVDMVSGGKYIQPRSYCILY
jgi:hypothetical protein